MSCLNPIWIEVKRKDFDARRAYKDFPTFLRYRETNMASHHGCWVPCGKCSACLRRRQQDLAARCAAEAHKRGSMCFCTLTYDEQSLPISCLLEQIDKSTGEIFHTFSLKQCTRRFRGDLSEGLEDVMRGISEQYQKNSKRVRYVYKEFLDTEDYFYRLVFTPSLNNRDVRLWLKNARVQYERDFGCKLPEFTYVAVGEYGDNTRRPHYHIAFFGLQREHVHYLISLWKYGFTYVQQVSGVNSDGSDGFSIASKYIGKYMTKGKFDSPAVIDGYAAKGRLMCSKGVGSVLTDKLIEYYRCYDVVGKYDINDVLPVDKLRLLIDTSRQRCSISFGNSIFVLPKKFIHEIWFCKDSSGVYRSSVVRRQMSAALSSDFAASYRKKLSESCPDMSEGQVSSLVSEFLYSQKVALSLKNERGMRSFEQFYLSSKF